jgi:hypothetical protein
MERRGMAQRKSSVPCRAHTYHLPNAARLLPLVPNRGVVLLVLVCRHKGTSTARQFPLIVLQRDAKGGRVEEGGKQAGNQHQDSPH